MDSHPRRHEDRVVDLPGGLLLREARPADLDQIAALLADRGDPNDPEDHCLVVDDPDGGFDACAVVLDGDRVVSTATLLDETVVLGGLPSPVRRARVRGPDGPTGVEVGSGGRGDPPTRRPLHT